MKFSIKTIPILIFKKYNKIYWGDKKIEEKLIEYIKEEFSVDPDIEITSDTKLISGGIIDSFSLVSLQIFIEKEFGKKIPAPRITSTTFDTVRDMVAVINQF